MPSILRAGLLFLFLLPVFHGFSQSLDLARAAATCIPSAAGSAANLRSFSANQPAIELQARFSLQGANRACWDFPLQADLSQTSALRLRYRSFNTALVNQFNVYLRVGNSWYAAAFAPEGDGAWEEAIIPKSGFLPEGASNSWRQANMLRIAAWRGGAGEVLLQFAGIELLAPNCSIVFVAQPAVGVTAEGGLQLRQASGRKSVPGRAFSCGSRRGGLQRQPVVSISASTATLCRGRLAGTAEGAQPVCAKPRQTRGFSCSAAAFGGPAAISGRAFYAF